MCGVMAAQLADIIWMDGEKKDLYSNPLEEYFLKRRKRRPAFYVLDVCRRGYVATWEVRDGQLFLINLEGDIESNSIFSRKIKKCTVSTIFKKADPKGVKAVWFSGKLRVPQGNMTQYEDSGYESRFEKEIILTVENGEVLKKRTLDYTHRTLVVQEIASTLYIPSVGL
jgi:hypothetical protein